MKMKMKMKHVSGYKKRPGSSEKSNMLQPRWGNRIAEFSFIALFMAALLLPLAKINLTGGAVSEQENRMLASRPAIPTLFSATSDFIMQFDAYFSDNVGYREQMINLYKKIAASESEGQYSDGGYLYVVGQEGHHYFAHVDGSLIGKFQGKPLLSDEEYIGLTNGLNKASRYLQEKGIPLIAIISPDKDSVYPEYYPRTIKRGPEPIQLDVVTQYLREHTNIDVYNVKDRLVAEKVNYMTYNKAVGDKTHYNSIGAFFEYLELIKRMNIYFPTFTPFTFDDVEITFDADNIPTVTLKGEKSYRQLDPSFFDNIDVARPFGETIRAYEAIGAADGTDSSDLPTLLVLGDSYSQYFGEFLVPHFDKAVFIHYQYAEHLEEYVELYRPDIVLLETAERETRGFANSLTKYGNK